VLSRYKGRLLMKLTYLLPIAGALFFLSNAALADSCQQRGSIVSVCTTPTGYVATGNKWSGVLTIYSSHNLDPTEVEQADVVFDTDNRDTLTITPTGGTFTVSFNTDPEAMIVLDLAKARWSYVRIDNRVYRAPISQFVRLSEGTVEGYLRIIDPAPGTVLKKGETGTMRFIYSLDMMDTKVTPYLSRRPGGTDAIKDPNGTQISLWPLSETLEWTIMSINNACHDWYLRFLVYRPEGTEWMYSDTFWVMHDSASAPPNYNCASLQYPEQ
jgi:hypothetical protein